MASPRSSTNALRIAVEGCGHGTLNAIYASVRRSCEVNGWDGVDLLIIGGDFQAVRNPQDLSCMSVPAKYRQIGDFHEYYSGVREAPYLTIFVGGNHEASNHLFELYYGGWVAPKIYYLGAANVVRLGPLRIAGMSGIWKGYNYQKPHYERLPYTQDDIRSAYHVREIDVRKLLQIRTQIDIGISHDWPRAVEWCGNHKALFAKKDLFEAESRAGTLGNPAAKFVLDLLRPAYWFAAHLHTKFSAVVEHKNAEARGTDAQRLRSSTTLDPSGRGGARTGEGEDGEDIVPVEKKRNEEEIDLDMEDSDEGGSVTGHAQAPIEESKSTQPSTIPQSLRDQLPASFTKQAQSPSPENKLPTSITNTVTKFLALDKCLPGRKFLQILSVEPISEPPPVGQTNTARPRLEYDKEWLAITRVFASELRLGDRHAIVPPNKGESFYRPLIEREEQWIEEHLLSQPGNGNGLVIPENFQITAPIYDPSSSSSLEPPPTGTAAAAAAATEQPMEFNNPQTAQFCALIGIDNPCFLTDEQRAERLARGASFSHTNVSPGGAGQHQSGWGGRGRGRGRGGERGRGRGRGRGRWRGGAGR